jgi:hypothetical protein
MRVSSACCFPWNHCLSLSAEILLYPMRIRDFSKFGFTDVLFPDGAAAPDD